MILVDTSVWVDHLQRDHNGRAERRIALIDSAIRYQYRSCLRTLLLGYRPI